MIKILSEASVLGGAVAEVSTWHSVLWLLIAIGGVMLFSVVKLPKTLPEARRSITSLWNAFRKYGRLLRNGELIAYTRCVAFFYVGAYAFIAGSPLVYITHFGVDSKSYGWLFAVNVIGIAGLSFANRMPVRKYSLDRLLKVSTAIAALAGIILAILVKLHLGGIFGIIIPVFFFFSMKGIISACTTAAALDKVPEMAGATSALRGHYSTAAASCLPYCWPGSVMVKAIPEP